MMKTRQRTAASFLYHQNKSDRVDRKIGEHMHQPGGADIFLLLVKEIEDHAADHQTRDEQKCIPLLHFRPSDPR